MNFEELYKPYSGKATLAETLGWLQKQATNFGISQDILNKATDETFLEISNGKEFATDGGVTGFDNFPHAVLNQYMLKKMLELHEIGSAASVAATEKVLNKKIEEVVKNENKKMKRFLNLNNSEFLKLLRIA